MIIKLHVTWTKNLSNVCLASRRDDVRRFDILLSYENSYDYKKTRDESGSSVLE